MWNWIKKLFSQGKDELFNSLINDLSLLEPRLSQLIIEQMNKVKPEELAHSIVGVIQNDLRSTLRLPLATNQQVQKS
jgi:hypothetical protein